LSFEAVMEKLETREEFHKRKFNSVPNASQRITDSFLDLLDRQFPLDDSYPKLLFRSPSSFASKLNVHVNHLNRSVKKVMQKTTSQVIAERVLRKSKILLTHGNLNISEIAYALGFSENTRFSNFFKKHMKTSPLKFKNDYI